MRCPVQLQPRGRMLVRRHAYRSRGASGATRPLFAVAQVHPACAPLWGVARKRPGNMGELAALHLARSTKDVRNTKARNLNIRSAKLPRNTNRKTSSDRLCNSVPPSLRKCSRWSFCYTLFAYLGAGHRTRTIALRASSRRALKRNSFTLVHSSAVQKEPPGGRL